jgi:uncharacterized protein (DUF1684 family)
MTIFLRGGVVSLWLAVGLRAADPAPTPAVAPAPDPYTQEIEAWRAQRAERLAKPDGWLTLIGLHFLKSGENTVGTAPDNTVVLAKGPAHLGTVTVGEYARVKAVINPGNGVLVDGQEVFSAELSDGSRRKPTLVTAGTVSLFVINRDGKKALRVRDSATDARTQFKGLDYFPIDPAWRIEAQWVPFEKPREVPIRNVLGSVSPAMILGKAVFTRDGKTYELLPIQDDPDGTLFFVISDLTSGDQTYPSRFLYAEPPVDGKVVLDFNRAQNPPCAFTAFATCPLPPKENQLQLAVTAGEKKYVGPGAHAE